jgi:hypothetical protein
MVAIRRQGFAQGYDLEHRYDRFGRAVPALNSFYVGYSSRVDHELRLLMFQPSGEPADLSPASQESVSNIPRGRIWIALRDQDPERDATYEWVAGYSLLADVGVGRFQIRDIGCAGKCIRDIPPEVFGSPLSLDGVLGITGFKLFYTNGDHHVDQVSVRFEGRQLVVALNDRNDDDTFGYGVDFVFLSARSWQIASGRSSGSGVGYDRVGLPRVPGSDFVIRGFDFDYPSGDHHLRSIGVLRELNSLAVSFADKEGHDRFNWSVDWAHVRPRVTGPLDRP